MPVTIANWLKEAAHCLQDSSIPSARLDAEVILAHTLKKPRTYLHAHDDDILEGRELEIANARLDLRKDRTPVAYIIGHKEFYGRTFHVSPGVLIPRPESEDGITLLNSLIPQTAPLFATTTRLIDVGTGSGALGITAKLEHPELEVHLIDNSRHALRIAAKNAATHKVDCTFTDSDLLSQFHFDAHYIIANLPYVDESWDDLSPELRHEPASALYAAKNGLALIFKLLPQAWSHLVDGGFLLLEADPTQHDAIKQKARSHGFTFVNELGYYVTFKK